MEQAVEYKMMTNRLDNALATLKSELAGLRDQDAKLMKSLITINDSIRQLTPKTSRRSISRRTFLYSNGTKRCVGVHLLPLETVSEETRLVRRQSAPDFCKINKEHSGSLSSIEDISSSREDCSSNSESDDGNSSSEENDFFIKPRRRSSTMSRIENETITDDVRRYEDILRQNVRLWKYAHSED